MTLRFELQGARGSEGRGSTREWGAGEYKGGGRTAVKLLEIIN